MTGEAAADEVFCICTFNTISQTANPPTTSVAAVAEVFNAVLYGGLHALCRSSRAQDYLRHRLLSRKMILMLQKASVSHA